MGVASRGNHLPGGVSLAARMDRRRPEMHNRDSGLLDLCCFLSKKKYILVLLWTFEPQKRNRTAIKETFKALTPGFDNQRV